METPKSKSKLIVASHLLYAVIFYQADLKSKERSALIKNSTQLTYSKIFFFENETKKHLSLPKNVQKIYSRRIGKMIINESFGEHIRKLREENGLPLRKVAAVLDIDPSTLSKIERGERSANKQMLPALAKLFKENTEALGLILFSDKVAYDLMMEENPNEILKVAEEKIKYLKNLKKHGN